MALQLENLMARAAAYKTVLNNTKNYRKEWDKTIKPMIVGTLEIILEKTKIKGEIVTNEQIDNLNSIVLDLGRTASGIIENIENSDLKRMMVKNNGSIIYQQLFNGKVMVMLLPPSIEEYGDPKPPRPIGIFRPHELSEDYILKHFEKFLMEITQWEDYDDDKIENKTAFNPIGFQTMVDSQDS